MKNRDPLSHPASNHAVMALGQESSIAPHKLSDIRGWYTLLCSILHFCHYGFDIV